MSKYFNEKAIHWDSSNIRNELADNISEAILKEIKLNKNQKLLDYGCGTGLVTLKLQPFVKNVVAKDSSSEMLNQLNKKLKDENIKNVTTKLHNIEKDNLEGSYDVITTSMTLHHIEDTSNFLTKTYEALNEGGYLAIADLELEDGTFHPSNQEAGVKHFGFDKDTLTKKLQEMLFRDIKIERIFNIEKNSKNYGIFLTVAKK